MQFIDQANIILKAGKGGNGIVSFRREKFVPAGGPSGGNGGKGGSIILIADNNLQTLLDFKFNREIFAKDGFKGGPNKRTGASGENTILKVPCGTEVRDVNSGIILGDLTEDKQSLTIAHGGRGGHGNAYYLSNQNRAPESFTEGQEGEIWEVQLELKLLAEVGIIGLPNAGKSTLISVLSSARPKIANYPFTTLIPNLGVVRKADGNGCLFAHIPGLISVAAEVAKKRLNRGLRLNYPEVVAIISDHVVEGARDGKSVSDLMESGGLVIKKEQVMEGISEMVKEVQVEATFPDGVKLVTIHNPIR